VAYSVDGATMESSSPYSAGSTGVDTTQQSPCRGEELHTRNGPSPTEEEEEEEEVREESV
jgi:hypothetical protein